MTVTLNLAPEVESGLAARAQASGMTVEEFLLSVIESAALLPATEMSGKDRAAKFEAWSAAHTSTPPLSDYAVSREAMYDDRND